MDHLDTAAQDASSCCGRGWDPGGADAEETRTMRERRWVQCRNCGSQDHGGTRLLRGRASLAAPTRLSMTETERAREVASQRGWCRRWKRWKEVVVARFDVCWQIAAVDWKMGHVLGPLSIPLRPQLSTLDQ
jgi:hypothetical protein